MMYLFEISEFLSLSLITELVTCELQPRPRTRVLLVHYLHVL